MTPITVGQLLLLCTRAVANGFGDKEIHISADDEGNQYHGLYYGFLTDEKELESVVDQGLMHDSVDPKRIVILG